MNTKDFIDILRRFPDKRLLFAGAEGHVVHSGYHLTEIKAAVFDTVDCGGQKNRWNETVLQLWVPEDSDDDDFMKAGKFVAIYDKVRGMVSIDDDAEVRIEYGDENIFPAAYRVSSMREEPDAICFSLEPPETTCKARDRRRVGETETCCS